MITKRFGVVVSSAWVCGHLHLILLILHKITAQNLDCNIRAQMIGEILLELQQLVHPNRVLHLLTNLFERVERADWLRAEHSGGRTYLMHFSIRRSTILVIHHVIIAHEHVMRQR